MKSSYMLWSLLLLLVSIFISACSQILLKVAANRTYKSPKEEYLNIRVIVAYIIFLCSTLLTMLSLRFLPLSRVPIIESLGYIFVTVLSRLILGEKINNTKIFGLFLILGGIIVFSV